MEVKAFDQLLYSPHIVKGELHKCPTECLKCYPMKHRGFVIMQNKLPLKIHHKICACALLVFLH